MSSDSDTDGETQIRNFLEAADTSLLNDSMFQRKLSDDSRAESTEVLKEDIPKSQRYHLDDNETFGTDYNLPESMQNHLAKKLSEILKKHYKFYEVTRDNSAKRKFKRTSGVKLLKTDDCFVNSYEDLEYDIKGPAKNYVTKRRIIDDQKVHNTNKNAYASIAVDANYIMSHQDMITEKKERKHKVFYYKMTNKGILHAVEDINEFTEIRHRNRWNEDKIKYFKKT